MQLNKLCALVVVMLAGISLGVFACEQGEEVVFSCETTNQKFVEVCDAGKTIHYTFGKKWSRPEMALSVPRDRARTGQWTGIGRYMSYSVSIPNGNTWYSVFWGVDRLTEEHAIEAGINVSQNGKHLATILCKPGAVEQNMEGIDLQSE